MEQFSVYNANFMIIQQIFIKGSPCARHCSEWAKQSLRLQGTYMEDKVS